MSNINGLKSKHSRSRISSPSISKLQRRKWSLIPFLATLLVISITGGYMFYKTTLLDKSPYFINRILSNNISCHYETVGDALPAAEDLNPPEGSIFFHETSCSGGLDSRQACSVESAARIHPNRTIYVLFSSPVSKNVLTRSCLGKLTQLSNVRLARVHIAKYAKSTPLAEILSTAQNNRSLWMTERTSDLLRFVSLFKYGGIYLDLDTLIVKRLDDLGPSWTAREDESSVNVAALALNKEGIGHKVAALILNDLEWNFQPNQWNHNGLGAINRAILTICTIGMDIKATVSGDFSCQGFTVYNPSVFYSIHYNRSEAYFKRDWMFRETQEAYGYHMWNRRTWALNVDTNSPFDTLSKKYCPTVREMYGYQFGS